MDPAEIESLKAQLAEALRERDAAREEVQRVNRAWAFYMIPEPNLRSEVARLVTGLEIYT